MQTNYLPLGGISDIISPIQTMLSIKLLSENFERSMPMNNGEILINNEYSNIAEYLSTSNFNNNYLY